MELHVHQGDRVQRGNAERPSDQDPPGGAPQYPRQRLGQPLLRQRHPRTAAGQPLGRLLRWRNSYYEGSSDNTIDYPSRQLVDVEAAQTFADRFTLTVGSQNVLNTFPQEYPGAADGVGNRYGQFTPFGFNGAFYYGRLTYSW